MIARVQRFTSVQRVRLVYINEYQLGKNDYIFTTRTYVDMICSSSTLLFTKILQSFLIQCTTSLFKIYYKCVYRNSLSSRFRRELSIITISILDSIHFLQSIVDTFFEQNLEIQVEKEKNCDLQKNNYIFPFFSIFGALCRFISTSRVQS